MHVVGQIISKFKSLLLVRSYITVKGEMLHEVVFGVKVEEAWLRFIQIVSVKFLS